MKILIKCTVKEIFLVVFVVTVFDVYLGRRLLVHSFASCLLLVVFVLFFVFYFTIYVFLILSFLLVLVLRMTCRSSEADKVCYLSFVKKIHGPICQFFLYICFCVCSYLGNSLFMVGLRTFYPFLTSFVGFHWVYCFCCCVCSYLYFTYLPLTLTVVICLIFVTFSVFTYYHLVFIIKRFPISLSFLFFFFHIQYLLLMDLIFETKIFRK